MRSKQELTERLKQYKGAEYIYTNKGFIAWQMSTGENWEILFIEVAEPGKGHGTEMLKRFVSAVEPPFTSVFVFRLESNETAGHFYRHFGFKETRVDGLYKEGAVLAVIQWEELIKNLWPNQ